MRHATLFAVAAALLCVSPASAAGTVDASGNLIVAIPGGDDYAGVTAADVTAAVAAMGRRAGGSGGTQPAEGAGAVGVAGRITNPPDGGHIDPTSGEGGGGRHRAALPDPVPPAWGGPEDGSGFPTKPGKRNQYPVGMPPEGFGGYVPPPKIGGSGGAP